MNMPCKWRNHGADATGRPAAPWQVGRLIGFDSGFAIVVVNETGELRVVSLSQVLVPIPSSSFYQSFYQP